MPRTCSVCGHPQRAAIDTALIAGQPFRNIAERFGTSATALFRHRSDHIPAALATAKDAEAVAADDLLGRLRSLNRETADVLKAARAAADHELRLKAITRAEKQIELEGRLLGELRDAPVTNILIQPSFQRAQVAILHALESHPVARLAVADALASLEASS